MEKVEMEICFIKRERETSLMFYASCCVESILTVFVVVWLKQWLIVSCSCHLDERRRGRDREAKSPVKVTRLWKPWAKAATRLITTLVEHQTSYFGLTINCQLNWLSKVTLAQSTFPLFYLLTYSLLDSVEAKFFAVPTMRLCSLGCPLSRCPFIWLLRLFHSLVTA